MHIDIVDEISQFDQLKEAWEAVYLADSNARFFYSWAWLKGWLETITVPWIILCVREPLTSEYVSFLPLLKFKRRKFHLTSQSELSFWGNPSVDHTNFLCVDGHSEKVFNELSNYLQNRIKWKNFIIKDVFDSRIDGFLEKFSLEKYSIIEREKTKCPFISLPDTWDDYLRLFLSSNRRRNVRRALKKINKSFSTTTLQDNGLEKQIHALRNLWISRWGPPKHDLDKFFNVYKQTHARNCFWVDIFWDGDKPISGLAAFWDKDKKIFMPYSIGYSLEYAHYSPGIAIIAHSIKFAIQNGCREYDCGRGGEAYKLSSLGAQDRYNRNFLISKKSFWA